MVTLLFRLGGYFLLRKVLIKRHMRLVSTICIYVWIFIHHVYYKKNLGYVPLVIRKLISLGVPYLVLSSLYMVIFFGIKDHVPNNPYFEEFTFAEVIMINFATGSTVLAYWYIPFILILFSLLPMFYLFIFRFY